MNPAILSLIALLIAIALSMATKLNVGVAAVAFAWLIGTFAAGMKADQVAAGFPASLFLTLAGVTLLFANPGPSPATGFVLSTRSPQGWSSTAPTTAPISASRSTAARVSAILRDSPSPAPMGRRARRPMPT